MAYQLIYTSTERGLSAGRSGFCTVARHDALRERLVGELERISAFERPPQGLPVIRSFRIVNLGRPYYVLSCIQDAGPDYSGRTNHIAHHLICEEHEFTNPNVTPASVLLSFPWRHRWTEPSRFFQDTELIDVNQYGLPQGLPPSPWRELTGNGAYARLLTDTSARSGCYLAYHPGDDTRLLQLLHESATRLDPAGKPRGTAWQVTLTTYLQATDDPGHFNWRCCWHGTALHQAAVRGREPLFDLTNPASLPGPPPLEYGSSVSRADELPGSTKTPVSHPTGRGAARQQYQPRPPRHPQKVGQPSNLTLEPPPEIKAKQARRKLLVRWFTVGGVVAAALLVIILGVFHFVSPREEMKPPAFHKQPEAHLYIPVGTNCVFSAAANGSPPIHYLWQRDDSNKFINNDGQTNDSYSTRLYEKPTEIKYRVIASNSVGMATSTVATLHVLEPPSIEPNVTNLTLAAGATNKPSLEAKTKGSRLHYSWLKDGAPLPPSTDTSTNVLNLGKITNDVYGSYTLIASNEVGVATHKVANVIMPERLTIIAHPASTNVVEGGELTLNIEVKGPEPFFIQWLHGANSVPKETRVELKISRVKKSDEGDYSVIVSNQVGSVTSQVARVTVIMKQVAPGPLAQLPSAPTYLIPITMIVGELKFESEDLVNALLNNASCFVTSHNQMNSFLFPVTGGTPNLSVQGDGDTPALYVNKVTKWGSLDKKSKSVKPEDKTTKMAAYRVVTNGKTNQYVFFRMVDKTDPLFSPIRLERKYATFDTNTLTLSVAPEVVKQCTDNVFVEKAAARQKIVVTDNVNRKYEQESNDFTLIFNRSERDKSTNEMNNVAGTNPVNAKESLRELLIPKKHKDNPQDALGDLANLGIMCTRQDNRPADQNGAPDSKDISCTFKSNATDVNILWNDYAAFMNQALSAYLSNSIGGTPLPTKMKISADPQSLLIDDAAFNELLTAVSLAVGYMSGGLQNNADTKKQRDEKINALKTKWRILFTKEKVEQLKELIRSASKNVECENDLKALPKSLSDIKSIQIQIQIGNQWVPFIEFKD
jgi:hypothetical protein